MTETPLILALLALIGLVILFLLPFFIVRIRREAIAIHRKMSRIEGLLVQLAGRQPPPPAERLQSNDRARLIKVCENCGRKNSLQDVKCKGCSEWLQ